MTQNYGEPLEPIVCPHCRTANEPQQMRCFNCGSELGRGAYQINSSFIGRQPPFVWLILLGVLGLTSPCWCTIMLGVFGLTLEALGLP